MASCPHCTKDLGSEFLAKADHLDRLRVKEQEIATLKPQAEAGVGYKTAMEAAQAQLAAANGKIETRDLMAELKVGDERALNSLRAIHQMEQAGVEEAKRVAFRDWVKTTDNPVAKAVIPVATAANPATPATPGTPPNPANPANPGTTANPATPANPANSVNPTATGPVAQPANPASRLTPAQVQAQLTSPAFLALAPKDQVAKIAEMEALVQAQAGQGPAV